MYLSKYLNIEMCYYLLSNKKIVLLAFKSYYSVKEKRRITQNIRLWTTKGEKISVLFF